MCSNFLLCAGHCGGLRLHGFCFSFKGAGFCSAGLLSQLEIVWVLSPVSLFVRGDPVVSVLRCSCSWFWRVFLVLGSGAYSWHRGFLDLHETCQVHRELWLSDLMSLSVVTSITTVHSHLCTGGLCITESVQPSAGSPRESPPRPTRTFPTQLPLFPFLTL